MKKRLIKLMRVRQAALFQTPPAGCCVTTGEIDLTFPAEKIGRLSVYKYVLDRRAMAQ